MSVEAPHYPNAIDRIKGGLFRTRTVHKDSNKHNFFESLDSENKQELSRLFSEATVEIIVPEKTKLNLDKVPMDSEISVTSSPSKSIEDNLKPSKELRKSGRKIKPHISARLFENSGHIIEVMSDLQEHGFTKIFLIAGDNPDPKGVINGSLDVLMEMQRNKIQFDRVDVAGYPEGNERISKDQRELDEILIKKQKWAEDTGTEMNIVTQMCFDSEKVIKWIERIRKRGVTLPIIIGVPLKGISPEDLLRVAVKSGVGDSVNLIKSNGHFVLGLVKASVLAKLPIKRFKEKYDGDKFLADLVKKASDRHGIKGIHIYAFYKIGLTMEWIEKSKASLSS